jgi:phosphoenolpyruvate carboxykinase (GTP)
MTTKLEALKSWVDQVASHTQPEAIHWCSGSDEEYQDLIELMLAHGTLTTLNKTTHPNCYLHLSNPNDVARVEHLTFVCTPEEKDAGPNNLWMPPADGHEQMDALFEGCMKGRIMYVALWRRNNRQSLCRRQYETHDTDGEKSTGTH